MSMLDPDKNWERFGHEDPYFGVISQAQFKRENLNASALDEFFRSGETHLAWVVETIQRYLAPDFYPARCLDFGCGVGRVLLPLAKRFAHVTGVDISPSMLAEAQKNCAKQGITNVRFVKADEGLSEVKGSFDLIHTFIVLQHIPPQRGQQIIQNLLSRLNHGGVGVFHLTYASRMSRWRLWLHGVQKTVPLVHNLINMWKGRNFNYPLMAMYHYDLNQIFHLLHAYGCAPVHVFFTEYAEHLGAILFFKKS